MSQNQNTSAVKTNSFTSGMVKDVSDMYIKEGLWTHARNVINNTHQGESGVIGNEPANKLISSATYDIIGAVHAYENTWVIFSTNDIDSEIGLFNESASSYAEIVNDDCLGFKRTHLVTGIVKKNYDCTYSVYFQDALSPDRTLNINNVPYKTTGNNLSQDPDCFVPEYTNRLDCEKILLNPNLQQPLLRVQKAQGSGQLSNGSYQAVIAYSVNGTRVTDYFTPTTPQGLWDHSGVGGSLDILIDQMDDQFDEFELVIITVINQQMTARKVGYYSTRQEVIHLDQINQSLEVIDSRIIPIQNPIYHKSEGMFTINGYLIRNAVSTRPDFNYQPFANSIGSRWVSVDYPADYYNLGGNKAGYMRDEVYAFFIRWIYASGQKSASYHIPGRTSNSNDVQAISGADVLPTETQRWQVYDTASKNNTSGLTIDGGLITSKGNMQYWESSELYPDTQPEVWGDLCGKPIRHHKFPTSDITHIHTQGGNKISILGVEFYNIQHPKDESGNPISDIIGYEILRGSREGNRSIIAKGLFNNMFEYDIPDSTKKGLYQNYPFNDLRPDKFLATKLFDGAANPEDNKDAVTNFKKDYLTFHSPDTTFNKPYLSGNYVQVYTEEYGTVTSKFEHPYKHPKEKLITNGTLATAAIIGVGIGIVSALGTSSLGKDVDVKVFGSGASVKSARSSGKGTAIADAINSSILMPASTGWGVGVLVAQSAFFASQGIDEVLDIIYKLVPARQYALQINSHGFYSNYRAVKSGNYRRSIVENGARYITDNLHDFSSTHRINNLYRNNTVAVQLDNELAIPTEIDTTRNRVQDLKTWSDPLVEVTSTTSSYYGALKFKYDNQYGQIDSISQMPLDLSFQSSDSVSVTTITSDVLFGGDVYINRYTEKNPYYYFNEWMLDVPDNLEFDYRNYINGPYPRYWANFEKFDSADMNLKIKLKLPPLQFDTPSDFHHLDRNGSKAGGVFSIKNAYIYLFNNGVRDFFVESELNLGFRDYGEKPEQKHYDPYGGYSDLSTLFRSDLIKNGNYYKYDNSLSASKLYNNFSSYGSVLPRDYDPAVYTSCYQYYPDRAIYSLQHQSGLKRDNWRSYLANNYKDFVHKINNIKSMNATGSIILFEDAEPVQFVGVDQLQTTGGVKITIGDGGLFNQGFQSLVNADDTIDYGSCQSMRSAVNTPFGLFWISQQAGKIMQYGGGLEEISKNGMKFWFAEYLPSALLKQFPNYDHRDNPVMGVGCQAIYDAHYELLYFTKKDYLAIDPRIVYAPSRGGFGIVDGTESYVTVPGAVPIVMAERPRFTPVTLGDPRYFQDASWTVSYDPKLKAWLGFHDWHPDLLIPSYKNFLSVKNNEFWKHNDRTDKYANYYGQDYPWEIEFPVVTPADVTTLRNIEYTLECYNYMNNGRDAFHLLDENFNRAAIYNSEQHSGNLKLNLKGKNAPGDQLSYPVLNTDGIQILYSKEENRYRFNQFWDVTKDRGEFTGSKIPMFITEPNGYVVNLNPEYVNYKKSPLERKKFRHYGNRIILRRLISNAVKMILKFTSTKQQQSSR